MAIDYIVLGTWLPRTPIHLREIYDFLKNGTGIDLDSRQLQTFHRELKVENIAFVNNADFDSITFTSGLITITITEDGIVKLMTNEIKNIKNSLKAIESFHIKKLGPTLAYLFSRGAPLPQTLVTLTELYPKILVGHDITPEEAHKIITTEESVLLSTVSTDDLTVYYGQDIEIINVSKKNSALEAMITATIFIDSFSDLLKRYLTAHRAIWADIDSIRGAHNIRYRDFPLIRNKILESIKNISFIKTRLSQMSEILAARDMITTEAVKLKLRKLGLEDFKMLHSSSTYFENLWQMTADYAQSTLALFESLVAENTQRELRLLQGVTIVGVLVGFFGMNIAFPWEERWSEVSLSSWAVIGIIIVALMIFYGITKMVILNRRFDISSKGNKKILS